jgi:Ni,Fe-hydrogenase I large subunit
VPDAAFCAAPHRQGVPAETGALARRHAAGPVGVLLQAGHRLAARLLATVLDALDWTRRLRTSAAAQPVVDAAALADGAGLACVDTARGVLIHAVRIEGERVADYAIVAPTEWNFHPDGAFVREAAGWTAPDRVAARRRLAALALGLNPCVPFAIELAEMGHA